jgi:hypothetical protein
MAAYAVVDYTTDVGTLREVMAAMETKLETLDSTSNTPIYIIDVKQVAGDNFQGCILYTG